MDRKLDVSFGLHGIDTIRASVAWERYREILWLRYPVTPIQVEISKGW